MQRAFIPLALAVLNRVDKGRLSPDRKIQIKGIHAWTLWSLLRDVYPKGGDISLSELLRWHQQSDNNGASIYFVRRNEIGWNITSAILSEVKDMAIVATEEEMSKDERAVVNWAKLSAMLRLVVDVLIDENIQKTSNDSGRLWPETSTVKRIAASMLRKEQRSGINRQRPAPTIKARSGRPTMWNRTLPDGRYIITQLSFCFQFDRRRKREGVIANCKKVMWLFR